MKGRVDRADIGMEWDLEVAIYIYGGKKVLLLFTYGKWGYYDVWEKGKKLFSC